MLIHYRKEGCVLTLYIINAITLPISQHIQPIYCLFFQSSHSILTRISGLVQSTIIQRVAYRDT